ncbi:MAG TPA: prepilin-type N-terminal cleavage/methylation domain-containing protein [Phycisphaerales bacterium]|nr:prepilin-type N-terminal cleavage/methylation domain-containing protein [Phycisphaerales bacterium]HMP37866.1 prepilin-type N-terminal cleavage/methylation domain-containing protein [Phycisphaerales bacterium]
MPAVTGGERRRCGFTLAEVLVVIAIIAIVVSIALIAIRSARAGASRSATVSTLRTLTAAWNAYSLDHRQQLLPGFIDDDIQADLGIAVALQDGTEVPPAAARTWVWRLAPYADHAWQSFFAEADAAERAALAALYADRDLVEMSRRPSYGLNSIFLGGDSAAAGLGSLAPWNSSGDPSIAAVRATELRNPGTLVLFAPTRRATGPGAPETSGWYELRAPYLAERQWEVTAEGVVAASSFAGPTGGIPAARRGESVLPVAFADGSASTVAVEELAEDMRRWTPRADTPLWRVP